MTQVFYVIECGPGFPPTYLSHDKRDGWHWGGEISEARKYKTRGIAQYALMRALRRGMTAHNMRVMGHEYFTPAPKASPT
jgi:hypothetical protein